MNVRRWTSITSRFLTGIPQAFLALSFILTTACSQGNQSIDDFIGDTGGDDDTPTYSLDFDPSSWDFGSLITTSPTALSKSVTVTNNSGIPLYIQTVGSTASTHFTLASETCSATGSAGMSNGDSCTFVVEFKPTAGGLHNFAVNIGFTVIPTGGVPQTASVNFLGTGALPANLVISDGPTYDFGAVVATATAEHSFTVTNAGNFSASSIVGAGLAAPYAFKGGSYPGTGGTCSTTLAASASCTIVVTFNPSVTGAATDSIELTYDNGDTTVMSSRAMTGVGSTPAVLSISDGPGHDFGTFAVGASSDKVFTISNSGGVTATSLSGSGLVSPFSFKGGTFPGAGGTCATTLVSAGTCTIVVNYAPVATGAVADNIEIGYNNGLSAQLEMRAVQGTAVPPANLSINNGPTYNYGTLVVTGSADATFTISNTGGFNASFITGSGLAAPFSFKGGTFPGAGGTCAASLAAGSSCAIVVTFAPTAAGSFSDAIDIGYVNGASAQTSSRAVQGLAVDAAVLAISDGPTYDYGTRPTGSTQDKSLTVTNTGGTPATGMSAAGLAAPFSFKGGSYPGTGGDCAATLNPAAACTIVVTYAPVTVAVHSDAVDFAYNNGLGPVNVSRAVTGTGVSPAALAVSDGPAYDYGMQPIGKTIDKVFTLTNSGGFQASSIAGGGLAAPFTFKGGSFPGTGGTCTATLASSGSCTFVVTYTVAAAAASSDTADITYNDGVTGQTAARDVLGTGVTAASITISDGPTYDYGPVATGDTAEKTLTISNAGTFTASAMTGVGLAAPFTFKGGTYPGTGGTCASTLAGGGNCTVIVVFAPTATGNLSDTLDMNYFNGVSAQTSSRALQGVGTLPATLVISDGPTYNFGTLPFGGAATKSFTVTNAGGVPASTMAGGGLAAPFTYLGGSYPGTGGNCSTTLAASASCSIVVEYNPTAAATHNDAIEITYFDEVNNQTSTRAVTGIAVNPALLSISDGPTYSFGTVAVGGSAEATLTVTNSGQFASNSMAGSGLAAPYSFKGGTYPGTGGTCSTTLNAAGTCTLVVVYAPTGTGVQNDTLDLAYNNGVSAQTAQRALTGTGAAPASLSLSDGATFDYGSLATGAALDKTFTLSNTGGVTATSLSGGGLAAPYSFKGGTYPGTGGTCTTALNASSNCTIIVTFSPSATGVANDTIDISYFTGAASSTASRDVTGTGVTPATLTLSDGPTYDFGTIPSTGSAEKILTVTNSGAVAATAMSGSGLAAPFTFKGGSYPGTGGTCGASVAAGGGTCTVVIVFNPTSVSAFNDTVDISYHNGATTQTASRALQGAGAAPGSLTISDGPTFNFGSWPNGDTREKTFTVTNAGGVAATSITGGGLAAPYTFKGGSYPGAGGTCSTSLNPAGTCTIIVQYSPTVLGATSDTIELNYSNGLTGVSSTRDVAGTAVAPASITISDGATYDFGTIAVGGSSEKTFTLLNGGGFAASSLNGSGLAAPYTFKGGSYPGTGGTCASGLNVAASCTIVVVYAPTATGVQNDTIDIAYNDGVAPQTAQRAITGTGAAPALLSVSDGATYNYGTWPVGSATDKSFTITNSGGVTAASLAGSGLAAPFSFKGGTFPGTGGTCTATLSASGTCTIIVTFAPTATGTPSDTIDISYNDGVNAQSTSRAIAATAVDPANITISNATTYDFGTRANGSSTDHTFTVTNAGAYSASSVTGSGLAAPFTFKGGAYPGTGGDCGASLAPAATCSIVVTYSPTASGAHTDSIDINYNNGAVNTVSQRAVQGTGAPPASLAISDGPIFSYGTRATTSTTDQTFTVTNNGGVPATSLNATGLAAPFTFKGGTYPGTGGNCGATLAGSAACTIVVTYNPTTTGVHNDTLDIAYADGIGANSVSRNVTGTGAAPASITITDGPTYDFGTLAAGGSAEKTFTLQNTGGVPATSVTGGGLAAPYSFKGGSYPGTAATCAATLTAGATCTITVVYSPTVGGTHLDTIDISYNNGLTGVTSSRDLQGTAVAPAFLVISDGATFNFGTIPSTSLADKVFTINNTGSLAATSIVGSGLAAPFSFKGGTYPGTGGTCGTSINGGANCTIVVTFAPPADGSSNDTIELAYFDGAANQNSMRPIQGTGAPPASLTISDGATFNFGNIANGGTADKTFIVTNNGGVGASSMAGAGLAAPYTFKGGTYPGTGGTCATTLAVTVSCTIVVNFNPTSLGVASDSIEINYNDGLAVQTSTRAVTGTSVNPALLTIADGPTYDYGTWATGSTRNRTFNVTNSGDVTATSLSGTGLAAPFSFKDGTFPGGGGTCTTNLNAGATCTIVVSYSPTATGTQGDVIEVNYNNGAAPVTATRAIQGTGAAPASLSLSDGPTYDFGTLASGGSADKTITITNGGGVFANTMSGSGLAAPYSFKGGSYPGAGGTCGTSLAAAGTCTIVINYNPSTVATHTDTVDITYDDGVNNQTASRALTGNAVAPASISISDGVTYNFGTLANGASADKTFTLTNGGSFSASALSGGGLAAPYTYKGGTYPGSGGTCAATLAPAATCTIVVTFSPVATGVHNDAIDISYNDGAAVQTSSRNVTGTGAPPAVLAISDGPTFDFGTRATGSSTDKSFSVQNTGGVPATSVGGSGIAAPYTFKGGTYPGTGGNCGTTIAAGATCTVVITYAPVATGAQSDALDMGFNDGVTTQTSSRALQGTGAAPASLAISDGATYDFGSIATGGVADKTFTITNSGGVPATSLSGGGLAAPYTFKGGTFPGTGGTCTGGTLAGGGATCTFVVSFAPSIAGVQTDTVDITFDNGVTAGQSTSRDLTGTGVTPAILTISDGPTFGYGAVVVTGSADKSFTVSNTGSLQATAMSGSGLAAPFSFKGGTYPGTGGNCGATLAASGTCTIVVTFNPSATGGSNDTIDVNYNNGVSAQVSQRDIQGTGATAASITISDGATYNFGTVAQGSTSDKTLTLTNGGGVPATSMSGSGLAAPFTFKGGSYPGTGGTCTATLAASANCTVVVNYNPSTQATHNDTMDIGYNDGLGAQTSSRPLQGTSVAPASITISDGATYDFGTLATGASGDKTFILTNAGAFAASTITGGGLAAPFTFKGGAYPGTGGTCSATLNGSNATCTIVVSYSPVATGTQSDTIEINYNDGAAPQQATRAIQGTGASPALLTISDGTTYNFGTVAQGSSTDKSFTVTNTGGVPATGIAGSGLVAPYSFKGGTYPGGGGSCSTSLAAGANCTIVVTYNPSSTGVTSDDIDISYNDGATAGQSVSRGVQGTAVGPASITISDGTTYNFGTVANGSSNDKSFTLTNSGSFTASTMTGTGLAAPYSFKGGSYPGSGGNCSTTLAPAATCTVVVTFAPTVSGTHNDTIDIPYNNGATSPTAQRDVTGVSAPPATMVISDAATYNFGTRAVGSTIDKTFTVQNTGGIGATAISAGGIAAPYTFKGGAYPGTGGDCGTTLAAGATCSFVVTYAPTGTGANNDSIDFQFNDGVTATQTSSRAITGTGAAPANITITETNPYDFGNIANGGTVDKSFTLTNTGGVNATAMSGAGLAAPYTFKGGTYPGTSGGDCTATLAPAATCTVVVTFAPTSAGVHNDTLDITYNNGVAAGQTSSRDLTGTGVAPALLTISDGATFSYGAVVATGSADKTFTITNTGTLQATSVGGSGLAAPFSFKGGTFPGTGGTCAATLAGGNTTCTIVVTFNPSVVGSFSDTIDMGYNNGVSVQTSSRDVTGTGATAASITISDGATFSFGTVANGSSTDKTFTLTNGGGVPATALSGSGLAAPYTFKGGTFPGTGGTCTNGGTLAAAANCTIVVNYNPTTVATHNDTIDVGYNDGLAAQTSSRAMTGTAVTPASLTISDGATYDFGTLATGASIDKTFTITNSGAFTASGLGGSGLAAPFTFKGGSFPGSGGTCSATLNGSNATCTIVVTYAPSATGSQSDTIEVNYNDGAAPQTATRAVQGTGAAPALLTISDGTTFDFGPKSNGSSTDKSFTVTNTGGVTATSISGGGLAAPYTFKGGTFPGTGGTCTGGTLAASATCSVVVTFNPTVTGTHNDTMDISYNNGAAGGQTVSRDMTGTSTPPAVLTISDATTYNFGSKANGSSTDKTFTVTNSGSFTASGMGGSGLAAPYSFKGGTYPGSGGNCSTTLGTGGNCTIVVTYAPTVTGTHNDTIDITYNDGTAAQTAQRDVTATSAPPATLVISDATTYDYGTRATGSSTDKTFTVQNTGGIDATSVSASGLAAPFLFKGGTYPGTGGDCGTSIISGATCSIVVTYSPAGTGVHSDSIDFTFNDGVTASQTSSRGVQGTGAAPASLTISDGATYDFGNVATGGSADKTFTIQNTGGVSATSVSGGGLAAPYTFKGGTFPGSGGNCPATIAAGASCSVVVTFAPTVGGVQTDTFDLTFNNGVSAGQTTARPLTGTGITPASLTISDGVTFDYGPVVATGNADKTFTVTNSGMMQASGMGGASGLAAPFTYKGGTYPGTGGNCGATLSGSGATCTIVVTFAPAATGPFSDTIDFAYNNGVGAQTSSRDIQGTGATPASISISDGTTFSFGTVANGSSSDKTFTLTNSGGVAGTGLAGAGLAAPYTFKGGSFPGTGGTCTAAGSLAGGGATCTIVVNYNPSTIATHTDTIDVNYNNGLSAQTAQRDLTGTAVAPASITISDGATYNFGTLATGASTDKTFTITNAGAFAASGLSGTGLAAPFSFKGGSFPGTGGNCTSTLNGASATCTIVVTYAPTGSGSHSDTIELPYNDGAAAQTALRAVQGTGASPATITITDGPTFSFGTRATGTSTDKIFTLTNTGGVFATSMGGSGLAAPYSFKGGTYPGTGGDCSTSLAGGSTTCTIVVTFNPSTTGTFNDTIDIGYNNGVSVQSTTRDVTGIGATPALLTVSETGTYDFGGVATNGTGLDKSFTVSNSGGVQAVSITGTGLAAPFTFKGGTYPGTGGNCGTTLASGANCTVVITFLPTTNGAHSDQLDMNYNDGASGQVASRPMQGTGAAPALLSISNGATYSFGTVANGSANEFTFTVSNGGGVSATSVSGSGLAAPYSFKGGAYPGTGGNCAATITSGANCTIVVSYSPSTNATHTDTIDIGYHDGVITQTAQRDLTGTAVAPATITISDGATFNFPTLANGASSEKTFTITNTGSFSASAMGGTGLAAPFAFKGGGTYPGTGGTCSTSLAGGNTTCTIVVVFSPGTSGTHTDTIDITYNNGANVTASSRDIAGVSAGPAILTVSDGPTYDYGTVATTTSRDKVFTITNSGGVPATSLSGGGLAAPYTFKGGSFPGTGGSCTATLNNSSNCTVVVNFAPGSSATFNDTLDMTYNDGVTGQTASRNVTGIGAAPALLTMTDSPLYDYGTIAVGASADRSFTISNTGGVAATSVVMNGLAGSFNFKGGTYPGSGGNCGTTINAGANCSIVVTYTPAGTATHSDTIDVAYNDGSAVQTFGRDIQGVGATTALITVSDGATFNYGTRANGGSTDKTFTLTNSGGVSATAMAGAGLAAPFSFKGGSYPGTGGTCTTTLAASANCSIVVTYSPTAIATHNDSIEIDYNDGVAAAQGTRAVTGTSVAPASLLISDGATYDYGSLYNGQSADKTFTVTNGGTFAASSMAGAGLASPFTFKGGTYPGTGGTCGTSLSGGGTTCSIVVTFAPSTANTWTDTIDLNYNDGANAQTAQRALLGASADPDPPSAPGTPVITVTTFDRLDLSWTGSATGTGPITYAVWRSTTSGSGYTLVQGGLSGTTFNDTGVTAGTAYYYQIRATGLGGTTNGAEATASTPIGTFQFSGAPAVLDRALQVSWGAAAGATAYTVRYGTVSGTWGSVASTNATSPYTVTGLTAGTTYYIMVQATNSKGSVNAALGEVSGIPKAVASQLSKSNGQGDAICTILSNGDVKCWGRALYGVLGNGSESQLGGDPDDVGDNVTYSSLSSTLTVSDVYTSGVAQHACAKLSDGSIKCWGRNNYGQLGYGDTNSRGDDLTEVGDSLAAVQLGSGYSVAKMALGQDFTCALLTNGAGTGVVKCFGRNTSGQLGQGTTITRGDTANEMADNLSPTLLGTGRYAIDIAAGTDHACALLDNGDVKCWGEGNNGRLGKDGTADLGDGGGEMGDSLTAINLGTTAVQVTAGNGFSCARLTGGTVKCWGFNDNGQLGQDNNTNYGSAGGGSGMASLAAINLGAGRTATELKTGMNSTCAILDDNTIKCWGYGTSGGLGRNNTTNMGTAANPINGMSAISVSSTNIPTVLSVGQAIGCVRLNDASTRVKCWGANSFGQLGMGDNGGIVANNVNIGDQAGEMGDPLPFMSLPTGLTASKIVAGRDNVFVVLSDGKLVIFGDNNYGRLALGKEAHAGDDPSEMGSNLIKVNLGTGLTAKKIATSSFHTCAILNNDRVKCWGRNNFGQLGYGDTTARNSPTQMGDSLPYVDIGTGVTAKDIAVGDSHSCIIDNSNNVKCWGRNNNGQLGINNVLNQGDGAGEMGASLSNSILGQTAKMIAAGTQSTCAILADDTLKCWGLNNNGQSGKDNTTNYGSNTGGASMASGGVVINLGQTVKYVAMGSVHVCAILLDNTVKCWGNGGNGRLGMNSTATRGDNGGEMAALTAVNLGAGRTAKKLQLGNAYSCAILDNDSVKCWGAGGNGRLGYGNTTTYGSGGSPNSMTDIASTFVNMGTGITAKDIWAGVGATCVIGSDDEVRCWGQAAWGTLGQEQNTNDIDSAGEMGDNLLFSPVW